MQGAILAGVGSVQAPRELECLVRRGESELGAIGTTARDGDVHVGTKRARQRICDHRARLGLVRVGCCRSLLRAPGRAAALVALTGLLLECSDRPLLAGGAAGECPPGIVIVCEQQCPAVALAEAPLFEKLQPIVGEIHQAQEV